MDRIRHPHSRLIRKGDGRDVAVPTEPGFPNEGAANPPAETLTPVTLSSAESHPLLRRMSPPELLIMCYAGAIHRLREALDLEQQKRFELCGPKYACAGRIITHLHNTLDPRGGQLAFKLASVYSSLIDRISRADGERDPQMAGDCIEILTTLKAGWEDMASEVESLASDARENHRGRTTTDRNPGGARSRNNRRQHLARRLAAKGKQ